LVRSLWLIHLKIAVSTIHQAVLTRHEQEMADIRAILQQGFMQHQQEMTDIRAQQRLNAQDINELKASIQELRNLAADYIQGRSQT
jgi:predicted transcriptional regulator